MKLLATKNTSVGDKFGELFSFYSGHKATTTKTICARIILCSLPSGWHLNDMITSFFYLFDTMFALFQLLAEQRTRDLEKHNNPVLVTNPKVFSLCIDKTFRRKCVRCESVLMKNRFLRRFRMHREHYFSWKWNDLLCLLPFFGMRMHNRIEWCDDTSETATTRCILNVKFFPLLSAFEQWQLLSNGEPVCGTANVYRLTFRCGRHSVEARTNDLRAEAHLFILNKN